MRNRRKGKGDKRKPVGQNSGGDLGEEKRRFKRASQRERKKSVVLLNVSKTSEKLVFDKKSALSFPAGTGGAVPALVAQYRHTGTGGAAPALVAQCVKGLLPR